MVARFLPFTIAACLLLSASSALLVSGYPSEGEREGATDGGGSVRGISDSVVSSVKDSGKKIVDKFDQVFYGLLDEAVQKYIREDKAKGEFKDMVIRHRGDLVHNIKENLVNRENIQLDDVKNAVMREIKNRVELFNYVGGGVWSRVRSWSGQLMDKYNRHCEQNGKSIICFGGDDKKDQNSVKRKSDAENEVEREYSEM